MPSARTHMTAAAVTLGFAATYYRQTGDQDQAAPHPLMAALGGAALTNLPDLIEPALHPNHRRFFHSVTAGILIGAGLNKVWHWQPDTEVERLLRLAALIAGGAYLCHLCLDMGSPKSLPLI